MQAGPAPHPAPEVLVAFGLGRTDEATAESVLRHIELCPECRRRVADAPPDRFLARLRGDVGPSDRTPEPQHPLSELSHTVSRAPGAGAQEPIPLALAQNPDYQVVRKLGQGGMGVVYLVRNVLMDRFEVLKVMNRDAIDRPGAVERFLREIRAAAQLAHPNVVRAYAAARVGDVLTFAMEYVDGDDLARVVEKRGPLPIAHACHYVRQAALGLQHAHEHGMVHRDIKPANLILARADRRHTVKVLDFGLAKATSEQAGDGALTGADQIMGTPLYMSPEQTRSAARADIRADIYSLGCTLYHLLTGRPPFVAESVFDVLVSHREDTAPPLDAVRGDVPPGLAAAAAKMLAKAPADRFQTPGEVAAALAPFVRTAAATEPTRHRHGGPGDDTEPTSAEVNAPGAFSDLWDSDTQADRHEEPELRQTGLPKWLWAVTAVGLLACGLMVAWAAGALRVKTQHGTVVVENVPADADVEIDGERVTLTRNGEAVTVSAVKDGPHRLKVVQGGREVWSSDVTVKVGGGTVRVRAEARPAEPEARPAPPAPPIPPAEPVAAKEEFAALFNGTNLTGWDRAGPKVTQMSITGGELVARNNGPPGYIDHLVTARTDYANGRLRCQFQLADPKSAARVMARVDPSPVVFGGMRGYAVTVLGAKPGAEGKAGRVTLALESRVRQPFVLAQADCPALAVEEWHALELLAVGDRLTVLINGKRVLDHTDEGPTFSRGAFALEFVPGDGVRYRKVEHAAAAPPPAALPADPRTRWVHQTVTGNEFNERWVAYQHAGGKKWVRAGTDHPHGFDRSEYTETERTKEYVELEPAAGGPVVRIYDEHTEAGPSRNALRKRFTGGWVK